MHRDQSQEHDLNDVILLRGCIELSLRNAINNEEVAHVKIENTVVTAGRKWVLQNLASSESATSQVISHLAVGTSTTAPATGDTILGSEVSRIAINSFTTSNLTSNPPSWRAEASWATNQANTTLGEVGLFNTSTANAQTLLAHATFSTIDKTTSNTLAISYTISN